MTNVKDLNNSMLTSKNIKDEFRLLKKEILHTTLVLNVAGLCHLQIEPFSKSSTVWLLGMLLYSAYGFIRMRKLGLYKFIINGIKRIAIMFL